MVNGGANKIILASDKSEAKPRLKPSPGSQGLKVQSPIQTAFKEEVWAEVVGKSGLPGGLELVSRPGQRWGEGRSGMVSQAAEASCPQAGSPG